MHRIRTYLLTYLLTYRCIGGVTENLLKDSFAVVNEHEPRFSWLDHNHSASVKFVDAEDSEYEVWASHYRHCVQVQLGPVRAPGP